MTNLCVMDFGGGDHAIRVRSLHPGVSFDEVQDNSGFALVGSGEELPVTPGPTAEDLALIATLDPNGVRHTVLKDNPPASRPASKGAV